jgi:hypothetical protein
VVNRIGFLSYRVPLSNSTFQEMYELLRQHSALERIKEILSPFQFPEQLTIETTECGAVNSYYQRKISMLCRLNPRQL